MVTTNEVLDFWFEEIDPTLWFARDDGFDRLVRSRLGTAASLAAVGGLDTWRETANGCLALCLLLDQVPRNLHRGRAEAFSADSRARAVAEHALTQRFDLMIDKDRRLFLYLPFEHSEDLADQDRAVTLITHRIGIQSYVDYAERHRDVIRRFGRFPHRNAALGRTSKPDEQAYLQLPNAGF